MIARRFIPVIRTLTGMAWIGVALVGCGTPPNMKPSLQLPDAPGSMGWWVVRDPTGLLPPVVGVERRINQRVVVQVVFTERGFRRFKYVGGRLTESSEPLPGTNAESDVTTVGRAFLQLQRTLDSDATDAVTEIPEEVMSSVRTMDGIVDVVDRYWAFARVDSSAELTYRRINTELEHFPHGAGRLNEMSKALK